MGADVSIEQWGGNVPLFGKLTLVEPRVFLKISALGVEEQRVNVIIDFADLADEAEPASLGDSYRVEVRIVIWQDPSAVKVPVGAMFRRGDDWAVFVVNEGRVQLQPVHIGQRNDRDGQVVKGLSEGQTVVVHPPDTLTDGARVRIR